MTPKQASRGGLDRSLTQPPSPSATEGRPSRCTAADDEGGEEGGDDDDENADGASSAATMATATPDSSDGFFFGRYSPGPGPFTRGDAAPRTRGEGFVRPRANGPPPRDGTPPPPASAPPPANDAARTSPAAKAFPAVAPGSSAPPQFLRREYGLRRRLLVAMGFVALYWINDASRAGDAVPLAGRAGWSRPPAPRVCGYESREDVTWIMFMGDSNMRFTYYWWTQRYVEKGLGGVEGSTYGFVRDDIGFSGKWADQEFIVPSSNNSTTVKRVSFRFLHGSINEFLYDAEHWNVARHAYPSVRDEIGLGDPAGDVPRFAASVRRQGIRIPDDRPPGRRDDDSGGDDAIDWDGRVTPSDYAIWATRFQSPIADDSDEFRLWMGRWDRKDSPDVVVLTEGWLGVPRPDDLDVVRSVLRSNPRTLFVWSPIYVTGSTRERHDEYVASGVFGWELPNLRMVDLWGLARDELPRDRSHVRVGGTYMRKVLGRIWDEVGCGGGRRLMRGSIDDG